MRATILLKNCSWVITMNPREPIIKGASIYVEDGIPSVVKDRVEADIVINGKGKAVLPGLINAHTHAPMSLFRGLAEDLPLERWLREKIWPLEAKLKPRDCYVGARLSILEMLKTGTVGFVDMYWFSREILKAATEAGIRALITYGMLDLGDAERRERSLKDAKEFIEYGRKLGGERVGVGLGPHAPYTCSREMLEAVRDLADKEKVPIHIHVAETRHEQAEFEKKYGMREVEYLAKIGFLGEDVSIAHGVWLTRREIRELAEYDVKVVHCPISNLKVAVGGIAPVVEMIKSGVSVALGTDGAASNNSLDMFETMKIAALLQKHHHWNPAILNATTVLSMTIHGGSRILGRDMRIDGEAKCDIVTLDLRRPHMTPVHSGETLINHMVYSSRGSDVREVIIDGQLVVYNGKVLTMVEEEVLKEAQDTAEDIIRR